MFVLQNGKICEFYDLWVMCVLLSSLASPSPFSRQGSVLPTCPATGCAHHAGLKLTVFDLPLHPGTKGVYASTHDWLFHFWKTAFLVVVYLATSFHGCHEHLTPSPELWVLCGIDYSKQNQKALWKLALTLGSWLTMLLWISWVFITTSGSGKSCLFDLITTLFN